MDLTELRRRRGLSRQIAATEAGISLSTLQRWEKGITSPQVSDINALAKLYNVSADVILSLFADKPTPLPGTELPKGAA